VFTSIKLNKEAAKAMSLLSRWNSLTSASQILFHQSDLDKKFYSTSLNSSTRIDLHNL